MRILITGGSGSGKSTFAENLTMQLPCPYYYIATMRPYDEECLKKIDRHRRLRAEKAFITIEQHTDLQQIELQERGGTALLECMCNLTANELFDEQGNLLPAYDKILEGIEHLEKLFDHLLVVTNDVGSDICRYDEGTMEYIHTLGKLNQTLANRFDQVFEVVCGIPLLQKGKEI